MDIVAIATVVLTIIGLGVAAWPYLPHKPRPKVIRSFRDMDITKIEKLQSKSFSDDVRDEPGVIRDAVRSSARGKIRSHSESYFFAICMRRGVHVDAYLTAQYFPMTGTIFLWYIVNEGDDEDANSATLVKLLLRECDKTGSHWKQVVAEVESDNRHEALAKMVLFQHLGKEISKSSDDPRVFKLGVTYRMPVHASENLDDAEHHEVNAWIAFAPRQLDADVTNEAAHSFVSKRRVGEVLRTLIQEGYSDKEDPRYQAYLKEKADRMIAALPDRVPLVSSKREM